MNAADDVRTVTRPVTAALVQRLNAQITRLQDREQTLRTRADTSQDPGLRQQLHTLCDKLSALQLKLAARRDGRSPWEEHLSIDQAALGGGKQHPERGTGHRLATIDSLGRSTKRRGFSPLKKYTGTREVTIQYSARKAPALSQRGDPLRGGGYRKGAQYAPMPRESLRTTVSATRLCLRLDCA